MTGATLTPMRKAYLASAWPDSSVTTYDMANALGLSREAVRQLAELMGLPLRREPSAMRWTPERRAEAFRLWTEGHSATQIAKQLGGITRNAVIGVVHRAGLKRNDWAETNRLKSAKVIIERRTHPHPAQRRAYIIAGGGAVIKKPPGQAPPTHAKALAFETLPGSEPIPWTLRALGACAWPVDIPEAQEQHSCALKCEDGQTYCAQHLEMRADRSRPKPSANELSRSLRRYAA